MSRSRGDMERLYREQGPKLWRAVFLFAGDRETANDAVAEAFAQALRRGEAIESLLPWVWRAAFKIAAGYLKDRSRQPVPMDETSYELPLDAAELAGALRALSRKQRAAVVLRYYCDYSTAEIARTIGSTPGAVGVHLFRARRTLETLLGDRDD